MDFSKFDEKIDKEQLQKDITEAAKIGIVTNGKGAVSFTLRRKEVESGLEVGTAKNGNYKEVESGTYTCKIDKLEVGTTNDGRPMLKAQLRILGDADENKCDFTNQCLFMNRVLFGTKNDANMIASAVGWLKSVEDDMDVEFTGYQDFADLVMNIEEDIDGLRYVVEYDKDAFGSTGRKEA